MAISFDVIPETLRVPGAYTEFDGSKAGGESIIRPYKVLLVGQRLSTGTKAALEFLRITDPAQANTYFGAGSMLAAMCKAFLTVNGFTEMIAVALDDDGAAAAASATVTLTGTATAAGTLSVLVCGTRVRVGVAAGDTAAEIATALAAAITAATSLPVTAAAVSAVVTLTARNKGAAGNALDVRPNYYTGEETPAGLTVACSAFSGGTANPDLDDLIAAMGDGYYTMVVTPYTDTASLDNLKAEFERRWGPTVAQYGMHITAEPGTYGQLAAVGETRNNKFETILSASGVPTPAWSVAAAYAANMSYYGNIDPARPFRTLALTDVLAPAQADRLTLTERNLLLYDGIATFVTDVDGTPRIERAITTYQLSPAGGADTAWLQVNTLLTLEVLGYSLRNMVLTRYPRHKIASDGYPQKPGQAVVTPKRLRADIIDLCSQWQELGLVEGVDNWKNGIVVERHATDPNRLDVLLPPDLVNQLYIVATKIQFAL